LKEPAPLPEGLAAPGGEVAVGASEGEVIFCVHVPSVPEGPRKLWRDFLTNYARALKAKHDLPIAVEDKAEWVELRVRTA